MRDADGQHECDPIVPAENGVSGGMDRDRGAAAPEPGGYARGAAAGHVAGNAVAAPAFGLPDRRSVVRRYRDAGALTRPRAMPHATMTRGYRRRPSYGDGCLPVQRLPAQIQPPDQGGIAGVVLRLEVVEQAAAAADQHQQAAPRVEILRVGLEMLGEVEDALGDDRHLDLGAAG